MDKAIKNQVIYSVSDTYLKELNNKYTGFLGVMRNYLLEHLIDWYKTIMTVDLKTNNQLMNDFIDFSLPIDKYFECINDCV